MTVQIRVDGGRGTGFGHIVRSSALATALLHRGFDVNLITHTPKTARDFAPEAATITQLPADIEPFDRHEAKYICNSILNDDRSCVVVDSYDADATYQSLLRQSATLCMISDDDSGHINCDMLVNGNVYADDIDYEERGAQPKYCLGPEYVLLRPAFERTPAFLPSESLQSPVSVLITMGGGDPTNITPLTIKSLDSLDVHVTVVVGPGFDNQQAVHEAVSSINPPVDVYTNPSNLPALMYNADVAVTATGTTVYELLAAGTAIVGLPRINNQVRIATELSRRGLLVPVRRPVNRGEVTDAVTRLITDPEEINRMQRAGRRLIDGKGATNVASEIGSLVGTPN